MSALQGIYTAIYSTLSSDAALLALATGGIVNDATPDQSYPYVLTANAHEGPWHTFGARGYNDIVRIHIYDDYEGDYRPLQILSRIVTLLDMGSFSIAGYATVLCQYIGVPRILIENDINKIQIRHVPAEFRWHVHQ